MNNYFASISIATELATTRPVPERSLSKWVFTAFLSVALSLLWITPSAAAQKTVTPQAAKASINQSQTVQLERAISSATDFSALRSAYEQAKRSARDETSQDFLFYQTAVALRTMPRTSEASDLVEQLKAHHSQAYVNLPDAGREVLMPLYSVSAAAKSVEHYWQMDSALQHAQSLLASGSLAEAIVSGELDISSVSSLEGVKRALKSSDINTLNANAMTAMTLDSVAKAELAAVRALRLADANALAAAFDWHSPLLLKALEQLSAFEPQARFDLLKRAATNPQLGSAAIYQMRQLDAAALEVTDYLVSKLGDKHIGASAAAVLAEAGEANLPALVAIAHDGSASVANRRALLALKMMDSNRATEALRSYVSDPNNPTQLRKEVALWVK